MQTIEAVSPELQRYIDRALAEGRYLSTEAILSDAVRLLEERDRRLRDMREAVEEGFRSLAEDGPIEIRDESELRSSFNEIRREVGIPERPINE
jgi:putative addiction module CopG family antidote